jgi:hypothetical protein
VLLRRSAIAEAAANATVPGADLATIAAQLDAYYRMVLHSFPRPAEYQQQYWSMIGYVPTGGTAGSKDVASPGGGGVHWKAGFTAGGLPQPSTPGQTRVPRTCMWFTKICPVLDITVHSGEQQLLHIRASGHSICLHMHLTLAAEEAAACIQTACGRNTPKQALV